MQPRFAGGLVRYLTGTLTLLSVCYAAIGQHRPTAKPQQCRIGVLEGQVVAGKVFEQNFTPDLKLLLEPLRSGWIVRVLPAHEPRGVHDYAELATPPYQSVSPLLVSTDWSFRAQDAVAWNPRRFRYAKDRASFHALEALYPKVLAGASGSEATLASLIAEEPQGTLRILDAHFAPGTADQSRMAAAVASHLATTPHNSDSSAPPSPLGKLESMRFRIELELPGNQPVQPRIRVEPCTRNQPAH